MQTKSLVNGFTMGLLSYGTWPLGGIFEADYLQEEKAVEIIRYAINSGMNYIDTAELYGCNVSEFFLGKAIKSINRKDLFLASKVRGSNASYKAIKKACENSLKRVGVDFFDLYYIHWREDKFDLEDCMRAMEELADEGKIKNIGVSNFSTKTLEKAQNYCKKYKIVANQVHYNMITRECEKDGLLEYCQKNDVMLVAYRSVELGKLAKNPTVHYMGLVKKYKKTSAQISLNWLISQKNVVAIFHSQNKEHIQENLCSIGWKLSEEDQIEIRDNIKGQLCESDCIRLA